MKTRVAEDSKHELQVYTSLTRGLLFIHLLGDAPFKKNITITLNMKFSDMQGCVSQALFLIAQVSGKLSHFIQYSNSQ